MKVFITVILVSFSMAACGGLKKKDNKKSSDARGSTAENVTSEVFGIWTSEDLIKNVEGLGSAKAYLQIEDGLVRLYNVCDFSEVTDQKLIASVTSAAEISKDKIKILDIREDEKRPDPFDTACVAELTTDTFIYRIESKKLIITNGDKEITLNRVQGRAVAELTKN